MYTRWPATRPWLFFPLIENRGFLCIPRPSALAELQATLDAFISTSTKIPATDVPIDPYQWSKTATLQCAVTTSRCGLQDTFNRAVSARYTILSEVFLRCGSPLEFYRRSEGRYVYYLCATRTFDSFEPACPPAPMRLLRRNIDQKRHHFTRMSRLVCECMQRSSISFIVSAPSVNSAKA